MVIYNLTKDLTDLQFNNISSVTIKSGYADILEYVTYQIPSTFFPMLFNGG